MAGTALLERELERFGAWEDEDVSAAAYEHSNRISENYRRFFASAAPAANAVEESPAVEEHSADAEPVLADAAPGAAAPATARRSLFEDYRPAEALPAVHHDLFENVEYRQGELVGDLPVAPVQAPEAPAAESDEEDAVPTRRTMETLHTSVAAEAAQGTQAKTGARLSAALKTALAIVCSVILAAIVLIAVNTGIINSLKSRAQAKQEELNGLRASYEQIRADLESVTDPENIEAWATGHDMVRATAE